MLHCCFPSTRVIASTGRVGLAGLVLAEVQPSEKKICPGICSDIRGRNVSLAIGVQRAECWARAGARPAVLFPAGATARRGSRRSKAATSPLRPVRRGPRQQVLDRFLDGQWTQAREGRFVRAAFSPVAGTGDDNSGRASHHDVCSIPLASGVQSRRKSDRTGQMTSRFLPGREWILHTC